MNCDQAEELLAAYSLSAVSEEDAEQTRSHLTTCRRHEEALAEVQAVAARLPLAVDEREPSPLLRDRILLAFDDEAAAQARGVTPLRRAPVAISVRAPAFAWLAAAVLLLAVIGLAAWNLTLQLGGGGQATLDATLSGTAGTAELVYLKDDQVGVLRLDLRALAPDRAYQAWRIEPGGPVSLGLVPSNGMAAFSADLSHSSAIAITEEPAGGSEQPTAPPLLAADLR